jgi:hypothetical protein
MDIKAIINPKDLSPTVIVASVILFSLTLYLTYNYLNKDSHEDEINYNYLAYSTIPSILVTVLVLYCYTNYKPPNCDRLTDDFYS